jgi:penicillin-binding protein 1A
MSDPLPPDHAPPQAGPKPPKRRGKLVLDGVPHKRPFWARVLMTFAFLALVGVTAGLLGVLGVYVKYSGGLPDIITAEEYRPAILSEIITADGVLAGELYNERRKLVPYERIPKRLVQAFIASEDSSFFDHRGVDVLGTARAAINTLRKKLGLGGSVQGGSTLTQQTAKAILVTTEMRNLDTDAMWKAADKRVPRAAAPAAADVEAEFARLKREKRELGVARAGQAVELPADEVIRAEAQERLRQKAEQARRDEVQRAFLQVRAEKRREAFKRATAKTLERKIREALLARRLEAALTKEEILYLYLNNVYLGHHSYGVQAAAENYYRKDVGELTLAEMSLIAGLPQAPSRYSPFRNPEAAAKRRTYVLRRMLAEGMISQAEHDAANASEVKVYPVEDVFREFAPFFAEQVRRDVSARYGNEVLLNEGLRIYATMDSERQRAAQDAMFYGLLAVDKRQGYRGVLMNLPQKDWKAFLEKGSAVVQGKGLVNDHFYVGLVTQITADGELADVSVGHLQGKLPLLGMRWARKHNPEGYYPSGLISNIKSALKVGDVVVVRAVADGKALTDDDTQHSEPMRKKLPDGVQLFRLEQEPDLQGALVSIDPHRQYLVAMVGGYDFDANEFNRAFQACRQPGSAYKPLVYAAAIEQLNWTPATVLVDSPIVFDDPSSEVRWKPENYSSDFAGDVVLRSALVQSLNIPAVKAFHAVGIKNMAEWAKVMGLSTPMNPDLSAALGSSCVYPYELAQVYATFSRYGEKRPTYMIRKVKDRFGRTLEDHTAWDDPWAGLDDRVAGAYAALLDKGEQVISRESGYILADLLRAVVREGTGAPAQRLGKPAAGKTGTTNDSFDAWFAGFTRDLVSVSWVGYDLNPHPLGRFETGGRASLPIWLAYMRRALDGVPQGEFPPPPGAELVRLRVDQRTGKLASNASKEVRDMWFKKGTEPKETTPERGVVGTDEFMMGRGL